MKAWENTSECAFEEALKWADIAGASGPFDPAFELACREERFWLNEAATLERMGK